MHVRKSSIVTYILSLKLGDYGEVDKRTGRFDRVGNIFSDGKTKNASELDQKKGVEDDTNSFTSVNVKDLGFDEQITA